MSTEMPLSQEEYNGLKYIMASFTATKNAEDRLEKRLRGVPGAWRDIHLCSSKLLHVFESILPTIPREKLKMVKAELPQIELYVRIKGASVFDLDEYDNVIVPKKTLDALAKVACNRECELCDKHGKEVKRCKLRKLLGETFPYDLPEAAGDGCVFQTYSLGDFENDEA